MKFLEIRGTIQENSIEVKATYSGYDSGEGFCYSHENFFLNLNEVSNIQFLNLEEDLTDCTYRNSIEDENVVYEKGSPYIQFSKDYNLNPVPYLRLLFKHEGEHQRIKRIILEQLSCK